MFNRDGASFPKSKVAPYRADVLEFTPEFQGEVPIEIEEAHPFVQPLANSESLVVAARCHNRDGNPEFNAAVYEQDGTFARRFLLGDGLKHVAVARDGTIWTGYSDEGIFGNFGWGANSENEQKAPIGASGIARFNVQGDILWQCKLNSMADCYTLNVADDGVWSCPYTDFPIVCIKPDGSQRMWRNEMTGARGLIVDNHRVLLFGGYTEKPLTMRYSGFGKKTRCRMPAKLNWFFLPAIQLQKHASLIATRLYIFS